MVALTAAVEMAPRRELLCLCERNSHFVMAGLSEDAAMELEALDAIFGADFTRDAPLSSSFAIAALPHGETAESANAVARLRFSLPPLYPQAAPPSIAVESAKGLSAERCDELRAFLNAQAAPLLGEASVFTLVEAAREWLVTRNTKGADDSMFGRMLEREGNRAHEEAAKAKSAAAAAAGAGGPQPAVAQRMLSPEERAKLFAGTKVSADAYRKWLEAYIKETKATKAAVDTRPTGRAIFEGGGQKADDAALDQAADEEEEFDADVFAQDDDDVELDSLDSDGAGGDQQ